MITVGRITRLAIEVAQTHAFPVQVLAAVPSSGGSDYIEILLGMEGWHAEQRYFQLGVFRDCDLESVRQQIVDQVRRYLADHSACAVPVPDARPPIGEANGGRRARFRTIRTDRSSRPLSWQRLRFTPARIGQPFIP